MYPVIVYFHLHMRDFEWLNQMGTQAVLRLLLMQHQVHHVEEISDCFQISVMVALH